MRNENRSKIGLIKHYFFKCISDWILSKLKYIYIVLSAVCFIVFPSFDILFCSIVFYFVSSRTIKSKILNSGYVVAPSEITFNHIVILYKKRLSSLFKEFVFWFLITSFVLVVVNINYELLEWSKSAPITNNLIYLWFEFKSYGLISSMIVGAPLFLAIIYPVTIKIHKNAILCIQISAIHIFLKRKVVSLHLSDPTNLERKEMNDEAQVILDNLRYSGIQKVVVFTHVISVDGWRKIKKWCAKTKSKYEFKLLLPLQWNKLQNTTQEINKNGIRDEIQECKLPFKLQRMWLDLQCQKIREYFIVVFYKLKVYVLLVIIRRRKYSEFSERSNPRLLGRMAEAKITFKIDNKVGGRTLEKNTINRTKVNKH